MKSLIIIGVIYAVIIISVIAAVINIMVAVRNVTKYIKYKRTSRRRTSRKYLN